MADTAPAANGSSMDSLKGSKNIVANSPFVMSGPVAQNVKDQTAKTSSEFSNLAASRQTPSEPAATGQPLTHYHSFFSELLSWKNPRASGIAYVSIVSLIFVARYLDLLRYGLKLTWMALGVTVLAEVAGKTILSNGLATQLRPRKYYTIPKESFDALLGDVHELANFFVIESQRIFFAENVAASATAAVAAFLSYYLVKIVPYWGLAIAATTMLFFVPLIYANNQELIDEKLQQVSDIINAQSEQLRQVASKHTAQATEMTKQYMGDYTAKAQQMLRGATSKPVPKESDFPAVPKEDFKKAEESAAVKEEEEPLIAA